MADTDWNLHSKQLITPTDNDRMLVEPSDETAKAVEVGGFRNWLMSTALFNTLTTTAKNIIGAIEEVKEIADNNTTQLKEMANNWLYGKKINVLGDSITAGTAGAKTWVTDVATNLKCKMTNYAVGGAAFAGENGFWSLINGMDANADVNIIMGGVNDYLGGAGLGKKGGNTELTNYFVYDGLEKFAKLLIAKFPNTINIMITPLKAEFRSATTYNQYEIIKALYYIADKYNFILIDAYSNSPNYNPNIPELKLQWSIDGIHPNDNYMNKFLIPYLTQSLISLENVGNIGNIEHDFAIVKETATETIAIKSTMSLTLYNDSNQTNNNNMITSNGIKINEHGIYLINLNSFIYAPSNTGTLTLSLTINGTKPLSKTIDFTGVSDTHVNLDIPFNYTLNKGDIIKIEVTNSTNSALNIANTILSALKI